MSNEIERSRFEPPESDAGAPYWAASREQRFVLPWCNSCDRPHWFPRERCPHCLGADLDWREATGLGEVYAVSVMPKPGGAMSAGRVPYAVALVELDEGVRMMTNVVADDPFGVAVGQRVRLVWEQLSDGRHVALFEPMGDLGS